MANITDAARWFEEVRGEAKWKNEGKEGKMEKIATHAKWMGICASCVWIHTLAPAPALVLLRYLDV